MTSHSKIFGLSDAIQQFGTPQGGRETEPLHVPESFYEFTRDIWSQSNVYQTPAWFSEWHIKLVCDDIQWCLENTVNYCCMMPRGHLKSTICYSFLCWLMLRSDRPSDPFYLSYNYTMATHHMGEIKRIIESNPKLSPYFIDSTARNARFSFRYKIDNKYAEISPGGVFSFRRGRHTNTALIADDLLKDPTDPLDVTQVERVENVFFSEHIYIPNPGVITVVVGTPMAPRDLFYKLRTDERFFFRALPVRYPVPERPILAPGIRDAKWLDNMEKSNPSSFATEMMLSPRLSEDAYITENELFLCEDDSLKSLDVKIEHKLESTCTIAGFDVGKRRHPSHLSIYRTDPITNEVIQVCQKWLDGWNYEDQIALLNDVVVNFGINRAYFDGTRGELDERNIDPIWRSLSLQTKTRQSVAQSFETGVYSEKLRMIKDDRQHNQIIAVNVDFRAAEVAMGHGESFWSNSLALYAHKEMTGGFGQSIEMVGDLGVMASQVNEMIATNEPNKNSIIHEGVCPNCGYSAGWIPEHNKCMICFTNGLSDIMYHQGQTKEELTTHFYDATKKSD